MSYFFEFESRCSHWTPLPILRGCGLHYYLIPFPNEEEAKAGISFLQAGFTMKLMTFAAYPSIGSEYNDKIETEQS